MYYLGSNVFWWPIHKILVDGIFDVSIDGIDNFLFLIYNFCVFKFYLIEKSKDNFKRKIIFNFTFNKQKVVPTPPKL